MEVNSFSEKVVNQIIRVGLEFKGKDNYILIIVVTKFIEVELSFDFHSLINFDFEV